jgi:hypothetical protein
MNEQRLYGDQSAALFSADKNRLPKLIRRDCQGIYRQKEWKRDNGRDLILIPIVGA